MTIGIDLVEIERFTQWHTYSEQQLRKVYSTQEIAYCRAVPQKSAERFAVRFAAKEALFKALAPHASTPAPLLTLFGAVEVQTGPHGVESNVDWKALDRYYPTLNASSVSIQTSLTHTNTTACAVVIITCLVDKPQKTIYD